MRNIIKSVPKLHANDRRSRRRETASRNSKKQALASLPGRDAVRSAIYEAISEDGKRAHELARWMLIIDDLRATVPDREVNAFLLEAAAFYRQRTRRSDGAA
jgi:hypothetical protein